MQVPKEISTACMFSMSKCSTRHTHNATENSTLHISPKPICIHDRTLSVFMKMYTHHIPSENAYMKDGGNIHCKHIPSKIVYEKAVEKTVA